eukprot:TRINITY_DN4784_c0_g2_i1.p1 TRINITY_DN4784_c0_g2~~TRINITY_DN4784_c0_g2_i1.p1  ORF type:complete len:317 (+),score=21.15 TRINITY_DN4784_c0_g2_i1:190-1140(+)
MDSNREIAYEFLPFLRAYKDGHIERLVGTATVPPSLDPQTGVSSKDVLITPDGTLSARLYRPKLTQNSPKFPILFYFHGGGFLVESSSSPTYHNYLNSLVSKANVLAVSVEYRRAPEHPLPTAYDDSWAALQWVASHAGSSTEAPAPEVWVTEHADFERVFLAGDSAGANIAHNMTMRAGRNVLTIQGVVLIHPYFWGSKAIGSEGSLDSVAKMAADELTAFVCRDLDDPMINPMAPSAPSLAELGCSRVLICVAEKDLLKGRGWIYYDGLRKSGWGGVVEILESEGEKHVFHLYNPDSEKAQAMMERVVSFLQRQ